LFWESSKVTWLTLLCVSSMAMLSRLERKSKSYIWWEYSKSTGGLHLGTHSTSRCLHICIK
jgi:hypothetical protein